MKRIISSVMALIILLSVCVQGLTAFSATKELAIDKLERIQTTTGYIPKKTAAVVGNCYGFIASVCEKLYGVTYNGEGLYNAYQCRHESGNYYTVKTYTTKHTSPTSTDVENIISFFVDNALTGDIVHYGSLTNDSNTHSFMIQTVDSEKMVIYHSNYASRGNTSDTCHFDTIYWDSFRDSPTVSCNAANGEYSLNAIFHSKMKYGGLGITINRYSRYESLFYVASKTVPEIAFSRSGTSSIKVSWSALTGASKYQVQYKKSTDAAYTNATTTCTNNYYDVTNLTVGESYSFRVRAYIGGRWMSYCEPKEWTPLPPAPVSAKAALTKSGICISWAVRNDISGVKIYKSTEANGAYTLFKNVKSNTTSSLTDISISYGETYYYKVVRYFVDDNGNEYRSAAVEISKQYVLSPPKITSSRTSNTSLKFVLAGDSACECFVYSVEDSKGNTIVPKTETTDNSIEITGLTLGEYYTIKATEKNSLGVSECSVHTKQALPPASSKISVGVRVNGINVSYVTSNVVDGYYIYRSTSSNSGFEKIAQVDKATTSSFTDKTVKYGVTYYYKVKRYTVSDGKVYLSAFSPVSKAVRNTIKKPSVTVSRRNTTSVTVKWNKVDNATKYVVQYKTENGSWKNYATVTGTSKIVGSLKTGGVYYFRVKAVNYVGSGYYSKGVSVKVLPPKMDAPVLKNKSGGVSVSWQKQAYANSYRIYRATSKTGKYTLVREINGASNVCWKDTNVKSGKGYYYKVVCVVKKDGREYCSQSSDGAFIRYK